MTFDEHIHEAEMWLSEIDSMTELTVTERLGVVAAHTTIAMAVFNRETMAQMSEAQAAALKKLDD